MPTFHRGPGKSCCQRSWPAATVRCAAVSLALALGATACAPSEKSSARGNPPSLDGGDSGPAHVEPAFFDPAAVVEVAITLEPADWDLIRQQERTERIFAGDCQAQPFPSPYTMVSADVTIDGQTLPNVGVRKKGWLGSRSHTKPSLRIVTDAYTEQSFSGTKDLTLNNGLQDGSLMNTCIGYGVFARAGIPAPRCNFARVTVNGTDLGVYAHVEPVKKPFLQEHFGTPEGSLYEGTVSDFREGWLGTFEQKQSESDAGDDDLLASLTAALAAPDDELMNRLEAVLDVDAFLSFWAVEVLTEHWDGYTAVANNFFVYRPPGGKATFIPWGPDALFGAGGTGGVVYGGGLVAYRLYNHPEGRARYEARLRELLESAWQPEAMLAEMDRIRVLIEPLVDPSKQGTFVDALAARRERIAGRREVLEGLLAEGPVTLPPLFETYCTEEAGEVSATFESRWDDPVGSVATLDVVVRGVPWALDPAATSVTWSGPRANAEGGEAGFFSIGGLRDDGASVLLSMQIDPARVAPGDVKLYAEVFTTPGFTRAGQVFDADLHFDEAGTQPGARITGTFSGTLYAPRQ